MREPKFKYEFKDNIPGNADGMISLCGNLSRADTVEIFWARRYDSGYIALEGYTPLLSVSAEELVKGITIDKDLVIPGGADALIARADGREYICDDGNPGNDPGYPSAEDRHCQSDADKDRY